MSHCVACPKGGNISFSVQYHSFPRDALRCQQWIQAVNQAVDGWSLKQDSVLCSKHFEDSCYKDPDPVLGKVGMLCRGLKDDAVPTIFKKFENGRMRSTNEQQHFDSNVLEGCERDSIQSTNTQVSDIEAGHRQQTENRQEMDGSKQMGNIINLDAQHDVPGPSTPQHATSQHSQSKRHPCGVCDKRVMSNAVKCTACQKWVHARCAGVKKINCRMAVNFECKKCKKPIIEPTNEELEHQEWRQLGDDETMDETTDRSCRLGYRSYLQEGDLNLPLQKVYEQMIKIKEERAKRAVANLENRREEGRGSKIKEGKVKRSIVNSEKRSGDDGSKMTDDAAKRAAVDLEETGKEEGEGSKIKVFRARRLAENLAIRREEAVEYWSSIPRGFKSNLTTYLQRLESRQRNIPVTLDTSLNPISLQGDTKKTVIVKAQLTVPCLGKLYSDSRIICPRCGCVMMNMKRVVVHLCRFKKESMEQNKTSIIPDVIFMKEKRWKKLQMALDYKADELKNGLFTDYERATVTSLWRQLKMKQKAHLEQQEQLERIAESKRKACLKQKARRKKKAKLILAAKIEAALAEKKKKENEEKKKKKMKKKKKKKKKKNKKRSEGKVEKKAMQIATDPPPKSLLEGSLDETMLNKLEKEKEDLRITFGDLMEKKATDLIFSQLHARGLISVKKEPVDQDLQPTIGQTLAPNVNSAPVYPVSIIPSSLVLTNLRTSPGPTGSDDMDVDQKPILSETGLILSPPGAVPPQVQYENSCPVHCPKCGYLCGSKKELDWHQCGDSLTPGAAGFGTVMPLAGGDGGSRIPVPGDGGNSMTMPVSSGVGNNLAGAMMPLAGGGCDGVAGGSGDSSTCFTPPLASGYGDGGIGDMMPRADSSGTDSGCCTTPGCSGGGDGITGMPSLGADVGDGSCAGIMLSDGMFIKAEPMDYDGR